MQPRQSGTGRILIALIFLSTGVISAGLWWWGHSVKNTDVISFDFETPKPKSNLDTSRPTTELVTRLQQAAAGNTGQYAMEVLRLGDDKSYGFNTEMVLPAASMMKVPIMAATFKAAEQGQLNLTDTYVVNDADKESGSGPIEFLDAGTTLTIDYLLKVIGQNSDNTAPAVLSHKLGDAAITQTIKDLNMSQTSFADNTTTPSDLANMWATLYKGNYLTAADQEKMFSYLTDSIYEDRIPAGLPSGVTVVHKVGTGDQVWADSGIVLAPVPYVLVVMNQGIDANQAGDLVPELSKLVWQYESARVPTPSLVPSKSQSK